MRKLNMKQNRKLSVFLAVTCLTLGMSARPLLAQEQTGTEIATENTEAAAEQSPVTWNYDELTVGTTNPFDGNFFTKLWGNAVSDTDIRALIDGYELVRWDTEASLFDLDPSVVSGSVVTDNAAGDRTYTLTIYNDLTYCDGTPITAADYAFSMLLEISPQMAEIGADVKKAEYIVGYDAYMKGESASLAGLRILNDYTLSITIDHTYLPFFYEHALLDITPYPISVIAPGCKAVDDGNGICIVNEDEKVKEPIFTAELLKKTILDPGNGYLTHPSMTSGPYKLVSFDGETATLEINPYFKGNAQGYKPTIQRLVFKTASNDTMVEGLSRGEYGLLNKCVNVETLRQGVKLVSESDGQFAMSSYPRTGLSFISFCCERPTVGSDAVRKAIAMCLDKDQLVSDYVGSFGVRVDGYYGEGQWMYELLKGNIPYPLQKPADGDAAAKAKYESEEKAWKALTLDRVQVYNLDTAAAVSLLESDGWTLNRDGEAFDPEKDDVRCKEIDGELTALDLMLLVPEGNRIAEDLDEHFTAHLKEAGIALNVETLPMAELLHVYYRRSGERSCDMIYLASNFDVEFDPSLTFMADDEADADSINVNNTTGIKDQQLYDLAVAMRRTEPGEYLEYCQEWVAFEERFAQVLPMIPVYSNLYYDFYPAELHNYDIVNHVSWGQAIVGAYMGDAE